MIYEIMNQSKTSFQKMKCATQSEQTLINSLELYIFKKKHKQESYFKTIEF
jgi:hypothetical protein